MTSHRIRFVTTFDDLIDTPFAGDVNAMCWPRVLAGDFQEVVDQLGAGDGVTAIDDDDLCALTLSPAGGAAREALLADQVMLRRRGLVPSLDVVTRYPRDASDAIVATDVYSFHVDRAPVPADTYLCTYSGRSSEGLPNEAALRRVDVPETRAELLRRYGGPDDADFARYLAENNYDLHYAALPDARPYAFGIGNLWRVSVAFPGAAVLPCIHRAPRTRPADPPRLLLIS